MKIYTYTFRPYHIIYLLAASLLADWIIYAFSSGYECGFLGACIGSPPNSRGVNRVIITLVAAYFTVMFMCTSEYEKEIKIPMFGSQEMDENHPHWEDFQDFLKERNK